MGLTKTLAVFVTPHGFGHAARAAAVCEALARRPGEQWRFELFTRVPEWFFESSLATGSCIHHDTFTDVGLVQRSSLAEDPVATAEALGRLVPFDVLQVDRLAGEVRAAGCCAVLCDIAPLGIAVAERAGLPSILVENFTWDWVYQSYLEECPELERYAGTLAGWFDSSTVRVQAEPVCGPRRSEAITVAPVSRQPRATPEATRTRLGVPHDAPMVVVSMGGIPWQFDAVPNLDGNGPWVVIPGGADELTRMGRAVLLPHRGPVYHPDMMRAADGVVAKLGYSTVAEVYAAGVPLAYVPRDRFPESPPMAAWVREHTPSIELDAAGFGEGAWCGCLDRLLELPRRTAGRGESGADQVADVVARVASGG